MSVGLQQIREQVTEYLTDAGVPACAAWPEGERNRLVTPTVVVSLRKCQAGPGGFQDYLGERYDSDQEQWVELYGKKAELTFGLDLYAGTGEDGMQALFDQLAQALTQDAPAGMEIREFSCGETEYDARQRLWKRSGQVVCQMYLYAQVLPGGQFLDFEIRGEKRI